MGNSVFSVEIKHSNFLHKRERKSFQSNATHLLSRSFTCDKKLLSDMSEQQHVYASSAHINSQRREMGLFLLPEGRRYSVSQSVLTSRHRPSEYSSGYEPWSFSFPLHTARWPPYPSPILSHTHLKYLLHTRSVFYLCVCVWGDFVLQESEKDPLPVSNCLSHSTLSLNPPRMGYFFLFLAPSLFLRLSMGGFVGYRRHKTLIHSTS